MQTAVDDLFDLGNEVLPDNVTLVTRGEASALAETNRDTLITYGFALLIVFLVLIAQFEGITSAEVMPSNCAINTRKTINNAKP